MEFSPSGRTWTRAVVYAAAIATIFATVGWYLQSHEGQLKQAVLLFLLPEDWLFAGEHLLEHFVTQQSLALLISSAVTGTVVLVSALTFPLKEWLSASYEQDTRVTRRKPHEPPLWEQALEEIKVVLFYAAMTLAVLRLGHEASPGVALFAQGLTHLVLFITVAIDFGSPTLARHGVRYADIVRVLASRPLRSLAFGATFGLPPVLVGWAVVKYTPAPSTAFLMLALVNLVCIVVAVLAGTVVGGTLVEKALKVEPMGAGARFAGWVILAALLAWNGLYFGGAAKAVYHVSPVLKCDWTLVPETFDASLEGGWLSPALQLGAEFEIYNPTQRTAKIENTRVEFFFGEHTIASSKLPDFEVKPGATARQKVQVEVKPKGGLVGAGLKGLDAIRKGDGVLDTLKGATDLDKYKIVLVIPTPSGDFPMTLYEKKKK